MSSDVKPVCELSIITISYDTLWTIVDIGWCNISEISLMIIYSGLCLIRPARKDHLPYKTTSCHWAYLPC
jgi:hypothetical protein